MTEPKIVPIIDNKDLVRDTSSKAILANNKKMLEEHRQKKQFLTRMVKQAEEVESMKKDINEIKLLLRTFIENR